MILNTYIITYLICSSLSLFVGLTAAVAGLQVWNRWDINSEAEEQYRLEKRVYLIITVLSLGFFLRLLMIPLWFWTLHSMIKSIPGAMCLVGVHNISAPLSYIASTLKLVLPALYGYWLILNLLDRRIAAQPFMKQKLMFLIPLGLLILAETVLDVSFFFSAPPRQVSCCTSLFDIPREGVPHIVTESTWTWVVVFYVLAVFTLAEIVYFIIAQKRSASTGKGKWFGKKSLMLCETLGIIFLFGVFLLALHTRISPLFLGLPFHHCVFCLGQEVWDALFCFCMIFIGLGLLLIYFWVVCSFNYQAVNKALGEKMVKLLKWSGLAFTVGLSVLSLHILRAL
ncbi:MAG: hypothetical protein SV775_03880 [Thermodesulfobacteriota bacterium]|nr:hypothetical protein [Thermodesulfobacteriota bacterium]